MTSPIRPSFTAATLPTGPAGPVFMASSDRPSQNQKAKACATMLVEVEGILESLRNVVRGAERSGRSLRDFLADPSSRKLIEDRIEVAQAKITAILGQCRDVLPMPQIRRVRDLQRELGDIRRRVLAINTARTAEQAGQAAAGAAEALGRGLGKGLEAIGGVLLWLLSLPFRQPGMN
jgi:hypothetical protein